MKNCPSCDNAEFKTLIRFNSAHFKYCTGCAVISINYHTDYTKQGRATKPPDYATEIIDSLQVGFNELIVEVGCNDGALLSMMKDRRYTNLLGIDPSQRCGKISTGVTIENIYLDQRSAGRILKKHGPASVVVCRHVVEHTTDPNEFLRAISTILKPDGMLILETPNSDGILRELRCHE